MKNLMKVGMVAMTACALACASNAFADEEEVETVNETEGEGIEGWTPFVLGFASPVQLPWGLAEWDVYGIDLSLFYADAPRMYGIQLAAVNRTREDLRGLMVSAFCNWSTADVYGIRTTLGGNFCSGTSYGFEAGGVALRTGDFYGVDCEFLGACQKNLYGVQVGGGFNVTEDTAWGLSVALGANLAHSVRGMQVAMFFNQTDDLVGCQIGAVNYAHECSCGFQLGLINIISDNMVKALPLFNCYFGPQSK